MRRGSHSGVFCISNSSRQTGPPIAGGACIAIKEETLEICKVRKPLDYSTLYMFLIQTNKSKKKANSLVGTFSISSLDLPRKKKIE